MKGDFLPLINHLNSGLLSFDFGYQNDADKPSPISELTMNSASNTLHQRGKFIIALVYFFALSNAS
jgi:hypothetical protein